mgnify:CR=1 FL=1
MLSQHTVKIICQSIGIDIEDYKIEYDRQLESALMLIDLENENTKEEFLKIETIEKFKLGYSPNDRYWLKKFLKGKNFSEEFLNESGLFSKNYKDICLFSDRLMFPIFNRNGKVVAFGGRRLDDNQKSAKYINSNENLVYSKKQHLYALNIAKLGYNIIAFNKIFTFTRDENTHRFIKV